MPIFLCPLPNTEEHTNSQLPSSCLTFISGASEIIVALGNIWRAGSEYIPTHTKLSSPQGNV